MLEKQFPIWSRGKQRQENNRTEGVQCIMGSRNGDTLTMAVLALCAWGTWRGWQFYTGRNAWLDRGKPASIAVKLLLSLVFSWAFAVLAIFKFIFAAIFGIQMHLPGAERGRRTAQGGFYDGEGTWRRWGEDFIDGAGNWVHAGDDFVDGQGNWRRPGEPFQDPNGNWVQPGEMFRDKAGRWSQR